MTLTKEQRKQRILNVKRVCEEFLDDIHQFTIGDLYYFFYGIAQPFKYSESELQRIVQFLIEGKDLKIKEVENGVDAPKYIRA